MPKWPSSSHEPSISRLSLDAPTRLLTLAVMGVLRLYRFAISPALPAACRFAPSCSAYALEAIETHGLGHGIVLGLKRVGRCHAWSSGGYDPVPAREV